MGQPAILVVDDESELLELVELVLVGAGYRVTCAADVRAAGRALAGEKFDVIVTDLLMPDRDGLEFIGDLRRNYPAARIIAISGGGRVAGENYLKLAKGLGAHAVLEKPFHNERLLALVASALMPAQS
jgi:CheY-like chemotaxis protein